jgi:hypothetical protein
LGQSGGVLHGQRAAVAVTLAQALPVGKDRGREALAQAEVLGLRLVRALCAETHESWLEDNRHINMDLFMEQKKAAMKIAA